jgi:hypothetical protein
MYVKLATAGAGRFRSVIGGTFTELYAFFARSLFQYYT